jgi:DNA-binding transcriptional MerR regulator
MAERPAPSTVARPRAPRAPRLPRAAARSFTITELALEFDITPRAIRFYEDVGLLQPQRAGRNRVYTHRDRTRLKLTLRGKRLGLSLQEIKQLVDMYDSPSDTTQQLQAFLTVLGEHRRQLEQQREDLEITLAEIAQHEARCRTLLADAPAAATNPNAIATAAKAQRPARSRRPVAAG